MTQKSIRILASELHGIWKVSEKDFTWAKILSEHSSLYHGATWEDDISKSQILQIDAQPV